jgi:pimeloyl-ACP methyl ester carboxylesterase
MKSTAILLAFSISILISCNDKRHESMTNTKAVNTDTLTSVSGYSDVNEIRMYYETYGQGQPLVLLHGGGSTIQTSFGRIIPMLSKKRQLICIELQAHGRTEDRSTEISFEQDADDVAALLKNLNIDKTDILGFSNGGNTALQIAIRHPRLCNKIVAASILLKRNGTSPQFWEFMKKGTFDDMPNQYKQAFIQVNPDSTKLMTMYQKCANRMINFTDFQDEQIKSIDSPVLLINGDQDVASPDHIVAMSKMIPNCNIAIVPGRHGEYIGEITTLKQGYSDTDFVVPMIERFLDVDTRNK